MDNNTNPTEAEIKRHLVDDNLWTEEEWLQFSGYYFRFINSDGTTSLTFAQWEARIIEYCM